MQVDHRPMRSFFHIAANGYYTPQTLSRLQVAAIACTGYDAPLHLEAITHLATLPEWVMDGLIWQSHTGQALAAIGLSNNSVAVYKQAAGALQVSTAPADYR